MIELHTNHFQQLDHRSVIETSHFGDEFSLKQTHWIARQ